MVSKMHKGTGDKLSISAKRRSQLIMLCLCCYRSTISLLTGVMGDSQTVVFFLAQSYNTLKISCRRLYCT